jgi:hypothetical protein
MKITDYLKQIIVLIAKSITNNIDDILVLMSFTIFIVTLFLYVNILAGLMSLSGILLLMGLFIGKNMGRK